MHRRPLRLDRQRVGAGDEGNRSNRIRAAVGGQRPGPLVERGVAEVVDEPDQVPPGYIGSHYRESLPAFAANADDDLGRTGVMPAGQVYFQKISDTDGNLYYSYGIAALDDAVEHRDTRVGARQQLDSRRQIGRTGDVIDVITSRLLSRWQKCRQPTDAN